MSNVQYLTAKSIAQRISRNNKSTTFDLWDIVEWCAEFEIEQVGEVESMIHVEREKHHVENKRILLPCNLYRLLNVQQGCTPIKYTSDGTFINFDNDKFDVYIDYYAVAVDEENYPLIRKGHEEGCYWYCLSKLMLERYLNGGLNGQQWSFIQQKLSEEISNAQGSFRNMTRDDMNDIMRIVYNMKRHIQMPRTVDWGNS